MKKIISLVLIIVLAISVTACNSGESPEQAVSNALQAVKQMDKESLSKYLDPNELIEEDNDNEGVDSFDEEQISVIFEALEYNIISSKEDGDTAVVNVDITNIDMANVFGQLMQEAISYAFSSAFSYGSLTDEEMDSKMTQMFFDIVEENIEKTVTNNVDIKLHKKENVWKIDLDDTLQNALMGNLLNVIGSDEDNQLDSSNSNIIKKGINDDIEFATIMFKVTDVEEVKTLTPEYGSPMNAEEGTKFVVVSVEMTNTTKEEITFNSDFPLVDNEDREFSPYDDATWYVDEDISYRKLAPSIKEKGKMVYLVPETSNSYYITGSKAGTNDVFQIVIK